MSKLDDQLEELVGSGDGFGSPDAVKQHQKEIDLLKFKITRRDNLKLAIVSAIIGAAVAAIVGEAVTLVDKFIS